MTDKNHPAVDKGHPLADRLDDPSIRAMGLDRPPKNWTDEQRHSVGLERHPEPLPGKTAEKTPESEAEAGPGVLSANPEDSGPFAPFSGPGVSSPPFGPDGLADPGPESTPLAEPSISDPEPFVDPASPSRGSGSRGGGSKTGLPK